MGKIIISDNVSLDGVIQDPAGDEGFRVGGWVGVIAGRPELAKVTLDEALGTEALLLGRRSYEWLAARWPSRTGALADRLNSLPKYVVSSTLEDPRWTNVTVLKGDVVTAGPPRKIIVSRLGTAGQPLTGMDFNDHHDRSAGEPP
jgi:dihydrofolate reductase